MKLAHCISNLATVGLLVSLMGCTVMTDVDRSKIEGEGAAGAPADARVRGTLANYQGDGQIRGWAIVGDGATPAQVRIEIEGQDPVTVTADEPRPDLVTGGMTDTEDVGYQADVGDLEPGTEIRAFVVIDGGSVELANSPQTVP